MNITVNIGNITPHNKQNGRKEDRQEHCHINFDENEENKSIIVRKTIKPNASK